MAVLPEDLLLDIPAETSYQVSARLVICDAFGEVSRDSYFEAESWLANASELEIEAVRDRNWRLNLVHDSDRGALLASVLQACAIDDLNGEIAELFLDKASAYQLLRRTRVSLWASFVCEDVKVSILQTGPKLSWIWRHGPLGAVGFGQREQAQVAAATALSLPAKVGGA